MKTYICKSCRKPHFDFNPWCELCLSEMLEKEPNTKDSDIKNDKKTLNIKQDKRQTENETDLKTLKKRESALETTTQNTKNIETNNELRMPKRTEKESEQMLENHITTTSQKEYTELANTKTELIPLDPSQEPFVNLSKELSHSLNSLTNLETELFQTMKGLRSSQPDTAVKLYDPERVQTALECAKQIINSKRMKLDLFKFARELKA